MKEKLAERLKDVKALIKVRGGDLKSLKFATFEPTHNQHLQFCSTRQRMRMTAAELKKNKESFRGFPALKN